jgi:hypothetical protein
MKSVFSKAMTAWRLGIPNILRYLFYRFSVTSGLNPVRRLKADTSVGPYFLTQSFPNNDRLIARQGWYSYSEAFGVVTGPLDESAPNWFGDQLVSAVLGGIDRDWWEIPDFAPGSVDVKSIWEFSRFDWVISCTQQYISGNRQAKIRLESWLQNWCDQNPPYKGPNWKCGQEASIRVMHLLTAVLLMNQTRSTAGLSDLIRLHLQRIAPTMQYAIAQDNNHGTSEAAALFIGGSYLLKNGDESAGQWMEQGRRWLENRARRLIAADGSFSQYSVNYHRVVLDTYSLVEVWRRFLELRDFSQQLYTRCQAATYWLYNFLESGKGDAPNLGANDGARLIPTTDSDYRDYRPCVQLAAAVFLDKTAYKGEGSWNQPLFWFQVRQPSTFLDSASSKQFTDGGYAVLRAGDTAVVVKYPRFGFRPSQCDSLHVDLWLGGVNWLRDAGTYSYNTADEWQTYFPSTRAHNTVQFDDSEQMPKIGRFLYADWLQTSEIEEIRSVAGVQSFAAAYVDAEERRHKRQVELSDTKLVVKDTVSGFHKKAVLRWRLMPGKWVFDSDKQTVSCEMFSVTVSSNVPILRIELCQGWESLYYLQKSELPVLEVEVEQSGELTSVVEWRFN